MDLSNPYKKDDYIESLRNEFLPEDFDTHYEKLDIEFSPKYIKQVSLLGEVPSLNLKILEIHHTSEHDPRISITRESFRLMEHHSYHRVLAIFYSENSDNYRLSLLTYDYELEGKKVKKIISPPKRFSFFLGPDAKIHTPSKYLIKKGRVKDFNDLKDRFSIEVVNEEFYKEIALKFIELVGGTIKKGNNKKNISPSLKLPSITDHNILKEFGVRLIGRIIFCWFLKKKKSSNNIPLIPEEILSKDAVETNTNYYHSVLEKLFFEILNTPANKRKTEFRKDIFDKIPFLNGGLFEPHEHDFYSPYNINTLRVPDEWFEEFFDILEKYNFTIDENTSIDIELSVDPEMLGRIFENLLAEINPETEKSAKKATGSYYTPREIVDYMVDESIKYYLIEKTGLHEEKLKTLLSYNQEIKEFTEERKKQVVDALDELKILDPACGSGAFPMGIMQKIVLILQKVDPNSSLWLEKQLEKVPDPFIREEIKEELKEANLDYIRKLGIIKHSIYGVDIQQIAVEISKLRAFLSLIVDSKVVDNKDNRGLKPLPNLEFKFICANTLIKISTHQNFLEDQFLNDIEGLIKEYFSKYEDKERIKNKIKKIIDDKIGKEIEGFRNDFKSIDKSKLSQSKETKEYLRNRVNKDYKKRLFQVELWESYKNIFEDKAVKFFETKYFFPEVFKQGGFDIIIGNPPYGGEIENNSKEWIKKTFSFGTIKDSASLFVERGVNLLKEKGTLLYIITFSITFNKNFSRTRELLFKKFRKTEIYTFDRDKCRIFKSMTQSVSILKSYLKINENMEKNNKEGIFTSKFYRETPNINFIPIQNTDKLLFPKNSKYHEPHRLPKIGDFNNLSILKKMMKNTGTVQSKILDYNGFRIWYRSSGNFWYNAFENKPYNSSEIKEIKVKKSFVNFFIILINSSLFYFYMRIYGDGRHLNKDLLNNFPIPEDLDSELKKMDKIIKLQKNKFLNKLLSVFDETQKKFNSRLIKDEIDLIDLLLGRYFYNFSYEEIIYIINYDSVIRGGNKLPEKLNKVIDKIIAKKHRGEDTSKEEFQIDLMVYKLYNLTYDELKIIDPEIEKKINRDEWERS